VTSSDSRTVVNVSLALGLLLLAAIVAVPLWASLGYRSAVNRLHNELASVAPASAELVDEYVDSCWDDTAPASVRVLRAIEGAEVGDVQAEYVLLLDGKGFGPGSLGQTPVRSRERDDDLDGDIVRVVTDEEVGTVTVIADVYDNDSVYCLPFG